MGFGWRQRPCSQVGLDFLSYCSFTRQCASKKLLAQPIQPAEVVVFDIPSGLTKLGGNFIKSITLYKEEP